MSRVAPEAAIACALLPLLELERLKAERLAELADDLCDFEAWERANSLARRLGEIRTALNAGDALEQGRALLSARQRLARVIREAQEVGCKLLKRLLRRSEPRA